MQCTRLPRVTLISIPLVLLAVSWLAAKSTVLQPEEAIAHVGEQATVCGEVASAKYAAASKGKPTFLNLGKPYPKHVFTAVIFEDHRAAFGAPEKTYLGKRICVSGRISVYRGKAQIKVSKTAQIATP